MKDKFKIKLNKIWKDIKKKFANELFITELVFLCGFLLIAVTNFAINIHFGLYFLGVSLIAFSIFTFRFRKR